MKVITANFQTGKGWMSVPPAALDSAQTLVLVFGAKSFEAKSAPFESLSASISQFVIVGCPTSVDIAGACVNN